MFKFCASIISEPSPFSLIYVWLLLQIYSGFESNWQPTNKKADGRSAFASVSLSLNHWLLSRCRIFVRHWDLERPKVRLFVLSFLGWHDLFV